MSLLIENEEVAQMAAKLAAIRGTSVEAVVAETLRQALDAEQSQDAKKAKAEAIIAFVKKFNEGRKPDDNLTSDHSWLYDENGLPH